MLSTKAGYCLAVETRFRRQLPSHSLPGFAVFRKAQFAFSRFAVRAWFAGLIMHTASRIKSEFLPPVATQQVKKVGALRIIERTNDQQEDQSAQCRWHFGSLDSHPTHSLSARGLLLATERSGF